MGEYNQRCEGRWIANVCLAGSHDWLRLSGKSAPTSGEGCCVLNCIFAITISFRTPIIARSGTWLRITLSALRAVTTSSDGTAARPLLYVAHIQYTAINQELCGD